MKICESDACTGCAACMNICPHNSIKMMLNAKGFSVPCVDEVSCIECGLCIGVCPSNHEIHADGLIQQEVYAAKCRDIKLRMASSSGGIFTVIAEKILQGGGNVVACRYSEDFKEIQYSICTVEENLGTFRGSKYVQASPNRIYTDVKGILNKGGVVLFCGTACQVAALRSYLGKHKYDKLVCIDLICHGVCSQGLYSRYLELLHAQYGNSEIRDVNFRYKKPSWMGYSLKVEFANGREYVGSKFKDPYLIAFNKDIAVRDCCHSCPYAKDERLGDITLADFWGYKSTHECAKNYQKGISCVLINTEKGKQLFELVSENIIFEKRTMEEAKAVNKSLERPWPKNELSDLFWNDYLRGDPLEEIFSRYCKPYPHTMKERLSWFVLSHYSIASGLKKIMRRN